MTPAAYRRLLDGISRLVVASVLAIIRGALPSLPDGEGRAAARNRMADRITKVIWTYRAKARDAAQQFLVEQARTAGIDGDVYTPSAPPYHRDSMRSALAELDDGGELSGPVDEAANRVAAVAVRHTEDAARRVVVSAVEDDAPEDVESHSESETRWEAEDYRPAVFAGMDNSSSKRARPARWARVLTGADNCPFCVMLAARGAVYESEEAAQGRVLRPSETGLAYRYHNNCDCIAVPVYSKSWDGGSVAEKLQQVYEEALKAISSSDLRESHKDEDYSSPVQLRKLRKYLRENPDVLQGIVENLRQAA